MVRKLLLCILMAPLLLSCLSTGGREEPVEPCMVSTTQRIVIIGASSSAGGVWAPALDHYLKKILQGPDCQVFNFADAKMSERLVESADSQIRSAKALNPTLVVATDFLFWFAYRGPVEERGERFEQGLSFARNFDCPVLLGDVPDLTDSTALKLYGVTFPTQAQLDSFNAKVRETCKERAGRVFYFPMSSSAIAASRGGCQKLAGKRFNLGSTLWLDGVHPNEHGVSQLSAMVAHVLQYNSLIR
ncbi:MAG: hypothetical protein R3B52_00640 [Candidatus Paceibacterota bacterium]